ncbi:MAG: Type 1 glutamine amidotransferase-like domain-containing protein [Patescibacteria group bacterium]
MRELFLTSDVNTVAEDIRQKIDQRNSNLRTAFITTPIEKEEGDLDWHEQNKASMINAGFDIFEYTITGKSLEDLRRDLKNVDIVYVEGGSLVYMMNQVRLSGFDVFIREFIENGGKYIGTSTGSFIMAEDTAPGLSLETYLEDNFNAKGIGLVNFLVMPHWGSADFKESYEKMPHEAYNMTTPMIVLTNTQYVWVKGDSIQIVDVK